MRRDVPLIRQLASAVLRDCEAKRDDQSGKASVAVLRGLDLVPGVCTEAQVGLDAEPESRMILIGVPRGS